MIGARDVSDPAPTGAAAAPAHRLASLARTGPLRSATDTGDRALVQMPGDVSRGGSPAPVCGSGEMRPDADAVLALRKITSAADARIAEAASVRADGRPARPVAAVRRANVLRMSDGLCLAEVRRGTVGQPARRRFAQRRAEHAMAQAQHGSAPDLAGRDVANPASLILSAAMLLDWLATRRSEDRLAAAAAAIGAAVTATLADPARRTADMGGTAGTQGVAADIARTIAQG